MSGNGENIVSGVVVIGLKDVYDEVQGLKQTSADAQRSVATSLAALDVTMQEIRSHLGTLDSRNEMIDKTLDDHEKRMRAVERFQWRREGTAALLGLAPGVAVAVIEFFAMRGH